jgi:hypothetical protein
MRGACCVALLVGIETAILSSATVNIAHTTFSSIDGNAIMTTTACDSAWCDNTFDAVTGEKALCGGTYSDPLSCP